MAASKYGKSTYYKIYALSGEVYYLKKYIQTKRVKFTKAQFGEFDPSAIKILISPCSAAVLGGGSLLLIVEKNLSLPHNEARVEFGWQQDGTVSTPRIDGKEKKCEWC